MTTAQFLKNLEVPEGKTDVVLDTDAYNEIDDQYAISYMLKYPEKLNVKAIYAAPFFADCNSLSTSPGDGMEKSYNEIIKVVKLAGCDYILNNIYKGSAAFLKNETEPVVSDAAKHLCSLADNYSAENPLYVVAIGAITNIASAILLRPEIKEKIVVVWLGGHGIHCHDTKEFNMMQDVAAARVVFGCGVPLVQLPCMGVVSQFYTTEHELKYWLMNKTKLSEYLAENTIIAANSYAKGKPWSRVIWDVTAVAWLVNEGDRFMQARLIEAPTPSYDNLYSFGKSKHLIKYVYNINRDALMEDLFDRITR